MSTFSPRAPARADDVEFRKVIGPLSDPASFGGDPRQAFHLVIPNLPGFGFSAQPAETGWNIPRIARAWVVLRGRLGYDRWGAQGGDLGCAVTDEIAKLKPAGFFFALERPEILVGDVRAPFARLR